LVISAKARIIILKELRLNRKEGEKMKKNNKGFIAELKLNKFTYIAAAAVLVLAIVLAIVEGTTSNTPARNWFWMLAGVLCLGEGIVLYVHGVVAKASNVCVLAGVILTALGALWLATDILVNGEFGGEGSGWWLGLIVGVVVGAACYFIPVLAKKKK